MRPIEQLREQLVEQQEVQQKVQQKVQQEVEQSKRADSRGGRPSKRDYILEKAECLVLEKGAAHLTFDALTEVTGISKGGILYHFESKDALVMAMLERYIQRKQAYRKQALLNQDETVTVDAEIQAIIRAELAHNKRGKLGVDSAILAAAATNPCLMRPVSEQQQALFQLLDQSSAGPIQARVAWYAVLGNRLCRQLGLAEEEAGNDEAFAQYLLQLVAEPNT